MVYLKLYVSRGATLIIGDGSNRGNLVILLGQLVNFASERRKLILVLNLLLSQLRYVILIVRIGHLILLGTVEPACLSSANNPILSVHR